MTSDCEATREAVQAHDPERAKPVVHDDGERAFRHLMTCRGCRDSIPADQRGRFVSSFVLSMDA